MNIWPWSVISALKSRQAYLLKRFDTDYRNLQDAKARSDERVERLLDEINKLESRMRQAHFRNPATGRLMAKGRLPW